MVIDRGEDASGVRELILPPWRIPGLIEGLHDLLLMLAVACIEAYIDKGPV
jgi:hypothetical protein